MGLAIASSWVGNLIVPGYGALAGLFVLLVGHGPVVLSLFAALSSRAAGPRQLTRVIFPLLLLSPIWSVGLLWTQVHLGFPPGFMAHAALGLGSWAGGTYLASSLDRRDFQVANQNIKPIEERASVHQARLSTKKQVHIDHD